MHPALDMAGTTSRANDNRPKPSGAEAEPVVPEAEPVVPEAEPVGADSETVGAEAEPAGAAKAAGVACETAQLENDQPYRAIIAAAKDRGCDLIVMASHGRRGIRRLLLGSETSLVLTHSTIPVLVTR